MKAKAIRGDRQITSGDVASRGNRRSNKGAFDTTPIRRAPGASSSHSPISFWIAQDGSRELIEIGFPSPVHRYRLRRIVTAIQNIVWRELTRRAPKRKR